MNLEQLLTSKELPKSIDLSNSELIRFYWKYRGLKKQWERANNFWQATNDNLKLAYEKLDEKDHELELAYNIIQEDLVVAQKIQQGLLPEQTARMKEELEMAVYHKQLSEVGGDYYDFFPTKTDRYAIGVFDISGHGVSAALVMTYLKAQFMQIMDNLISSKKIVEAVNKTSLKFLQSVKKYATVNFAVFEKEQLHYVSGGGFGLLLHNKEEIQFEKGHNFLGLRQRPFQEFTLPFTVGDLLAIYTDGIVEAQNEQGDDYTIKRLNDLIIANQDKPVDQILKICVDDYQQFRIADSDDITLLIVRKKS